VTALAARIVDTLRPNCFFIRVTLIEPVIIIPCRIRLNC
jgi:hypothetical protein